MTDSLVAVQENDEERFARAAARLLRARGKVAERRSDLKLALQFAATERYPSARAAINATFACEEEINGHSAKGGS